MSSIATLYTTMLLNKYNYGQISQWLQLIPPWLLLRVSVCPYLHTVGQFVGTDAFQDDHFLEVVKICIPVAR